MRPPIRGVGSGALEGAAGCAGPGCETLICPRVRTASALSGLLELHQRRSRDAKDIELVALRRFGVQVALRKRDSASRACLEAVRPQRRAAGVLAGCLALVFGVTHTPSSPNREHRSDLGAWHVARASRPTLTAGAEVGASPRVIAGGVKRIVYAQGSVLGAGSQLGQRGLPGLRGSSAPRRPTSRGASPASAFLGGHLADGREPLRICTWTCSSFCRRRSAARSR
jgi:hypothetical protein